MRCAAQCRGLALVRARLRCLRDGLGPGLNGGPLMAKKVPRGLRQSDCVVNPLVLAGSAAADWRSREQALTLGVWALSMTERGMKQSGDVVILQRVNTLAPNPLHANQ